MQKTNELIQCACGCGNMFHKYDKYSLERKYINGHNNRGKQKYNTDIKIVCACGCGNLLSKFDKRGREKIYINGHVNRNKIHNKNWCEKIFKSMLGKNTYPFKEISCKECKIKVISNSPSRLYCDKCSNLKKEERGREYIKKYKIQRYNYHKKRMNEDTNFRIASRLRNYLRKALNRYTTTGKIRLSIEYGIDYNAIIEHLNPFPEDISKYHIDHIKPLCSFNLTNPEQIKEAFNPVNIRWLLAEENLRKVRQDITMSIHRKKEGELCTN